MELRFLTEESITAFGQHLISEEKSANTVEKYIRDARAFAAFAKGQAVTKELAVAYKQSLMEKGYEVNSVNSMLASINSLFSFLGWYDCKVKAIRSQRQIFCSEEKELTKAEYIRLLNAAKQKKNDRLNLIIQTICGTGIRVSELQFITVEAANAGQATVRCKGKTRAVFIVKDLKKKLLQYAKEKRIGAGPIFITRGGKPISRTNIWREMKALCADANPGYSVFDADGKSVYTSARIYTVVHGDSLWEIARKQLGDGRRYTEIVKLNNLKTNVIYSGQKLKLPEK